MLAHVAGAVTSKTAELDGEARRFAAAMEAGENGGSAALVFAAVRDRVTLPPAVQS